jgi:antitoxin (DNA-binding transcriptional repressor) of toxin-antitoxin stability system
MTAVQIRLDRATAFVYTLCVHIRKSHQRKTRVGIRDFRSNLSGYIKRAHDGQIIELTSRDEVVAELHPATDILEEVRRKPGALKGKIRIAPDFDELPSELIDAFES